MLEMKWIRENADKVQQAANDKRMEFDVYELVETDSLTRRLQQETEALRQARNTLSQAVGLAIHQGIEAEADAAKAKVALVNEQLAVLEQEFAAAEARRSRLLQRVPNIVSEDTPAGASDADNVEIRKVGALPEWGFLPKSHIELGELHDMIDFRRGVKTAGTRSYYLKGMAALLHRAVQQLALDLLLDKGFTPLEVPLMVREDTLVHAGFLPLGEDQVYRIAGEDRWLVGTSEAPLANYYAGEVIDAARPVKLAAASSCFRSEVGSAGRDTQGLYRVHQFAKVEQVVICKADYAVSDLLLHEITSNAEQLLQLLELPYRVMAVCTGDMSQKTYKQYDIETWMPSRGSYGETHSSSNLGDFQARRSNIRYRGADGKLRYCHTLNNTAVASPRILIPLLENHQQADGSIRIPAALQPYMRGAERIVPPGQEETNG
ncbi:serine--tRNA ligase [Paenibacillus protaetiae]|uniref:Serine--tRNA ligase n=1 Tax=Paenibacillus protaetiae TaxID=2509456 RepID=A0A4P6EXG2_9BACL|nr:serine--tRNA ligase [Paenibacillus protaetiae]QAY66913.1 serine--tRNA ligase [Paenibacillus protaetiae]